jgi:hypothetical protein
MSIMKFGWFTNVHAVFVSNDIVCFDLTRIADRLQSPTEPVSLSFQANRVDGLPGQLQLYFLIERLNQGQSSSHVCFDCR